MSRTRMGRLAAMGLVGLLTVACGDDDTSGSAGGGSSTTTTEASAPFSQGFEIAPGRSLNMSCAGTGSPTVLLEAGDESRSGDWGVVPHALAQETRTCAYDRAGLGRSTDATGCRQADDLLDDLDALLTAAEVAGPYVFVGESGGGYLAVGIAERHADEVAGIVLIDTPKAVDDVPADLQERLRCDAPTNIERRDYLAIEHAVWDDRAQIGDFPMVVISNDPGDAAQGVDARNVEDQQGWLVLSPQARQTVVTSGHDVVGDDPDLVIETILEVLTAARAAG